ncbi:MAG: phosphopantetheine-binding protein, partial [Bacteroidales bacterium]|nr:phosphopantetheine-binding protein [Bacteroidales bacterium]
MKLRGFRIELGEVENMSCTYGGIMQAVANVCAIGNTQHLCLYYVSETEIDEEALADYLAKHLTEYMVPSAYMRIESIPLTPNGKANRKALPTPKLKISNIVAPQNELQQKVMDVVMEMLQIDGFGITNDLVALGLSSLTAMRLAAILKKNLGAAVLMRDIMQNPTVEAIAAMIEGQSVDSYELKAYDKRETYPISGSQRGMVVD